MGWIILIMLVVGVIVFIYELLQVIDKEAL